MKKILNLNTLVVTCTVLLLASGSSTVFSAQPAAEFGRDAGIQAIRASAAANHKHSDSAQITRPTFTVHKFGRDEGIRRIKNISRPKLDTKYAAYTPIPFGRDACIRAMKNRSKKSRLVTSTGH